MLQKVEFQNVIVCIKYNNIVLLFIYYDYIIVTSTNE